jgi:hypothetical protein
MSVIMRQVNVPATSVNDNLLAGSAFEYLNSRAIVSIGITSQGVDVTASIQIGSTVLVEESPVFVKVNEFPVIPDEMFFNGAGVQGDRIVIRCRNTNAASRDVRVLVQITPV